MTNLARRVGVLFVAVLALAVTTQGVLGHATLIAEESDPADGSTIVTPFVVVLRFDEELAPVESSILIRDSAGTIVAEGGIVEGEDLFTMVAELPVLEPGDYLAHWIALTPADNGKTQGDVRFTVVLATPSPAPTPVPTAPPSIAATPSPTVAAPTAAAPTPSAAPTPAPNVDGSGAGAELILPLVLAGGVAVALAWFFLRRRPT